MNFTLLIHSAQIHKATALDTEECKTQNSASFTGMHVCIYMRFMGQIVCVCVTERKRESERHNMIQYMTKLTKIPHYCHQHENIL